MGDKHQQDTVHTAPVSHSVKRVLWLLLGLFALMFGAAGVILPILPTTPFVILAAFAFGKSSARLRTALLNNRTFGPMIRDWEAHGSIEPRIKAFACTLMAAAFIGSFLAGVKPVVLVIQAICIGAAATFILTRPSRKVASDTPKAEEIP